MKCPWRPRVSIARRRSHSTVWSSRRSPLGWSCGGSWMDGCCECLVSVPPPTPIWVGGSGSWRALSLTLLWSTLLLWPPCCSWPPGALVLTVPCTQAFKGPPLTLSTPGRPIGSDFPRGTILGNSWRHCHHQGGEAGIPSSSLRHTGWPRTQRDWPKAVPRLRNPVQSKGAAPLQAIPPTLLYYLFIS